VSTFPVVEVMEAVVGALAADTTLEGLVGGRIYNDAPDDAEYPHVIVSLVTSKPSHTFGGATVGLGWKFPIDVHVLSLYQGERETLHIAARVVDLLNFAALMVAGFTVTCEHRGPGAGFGPRLKVEANKEKLETRRWPLEFLVTVRQA
jgi:hypothetical protein